MVIFYALIRTIAVFLRLWAQRAHNRAKRIYESANEKFTKLEARCKTDEVSVGRPMDYPAQIQLLKLFDANEEARQRWAAAGKRLKRRKKLEDRIVGFSGRKVPYTFGLIDMAVLMKLADFFGISYIDFNSISEFVTQIWS